MASKYQQLKMRIRNRKTTIFYFCMGFLAKVGTGDHLLSTM
jgi:hypothetical protein